MKKLDVLKTIDLAVKQRTFRNEMNMSIAYII